MTRSVRGQVQWVVGQLRTGERDAPMKMLPVVVLVGAIALGSYVCRVCAVHKLPVFNCPPRAVGPTIHNWRRYVVYGALGGEWHSERHRRGGTGQIGSKCHDDWEGGSRGPIELPRQLPNTDGCGSARTLLPSTAQVTDDANRARIFLWLRGLAALIPPALYVPRPALRIRGSSNSVWVGRQGISRNPLRPPATVRRLLPTLSNSCAWLACLFAGVRSRSLPFAAFSETMSLTMSLASSVSGVIRIVESRGLALS
jgi:hypothetical protein